MRKTERPAGRRFQLILIKPSHYDADGYVVQWLRSAMPSNSLAAVFSLANGSAMRKILGEDFPIDVVAIDETNTRVKPRDITRQHRRQRRLRICRDCWRAVQRIPARLDLARTFRAAGVQVVIGGFHVSGCLRC